jgi:hypothetical protein
MALSSLPQVSLLLLLKIRLLLLLLLHPMFYSRFHASSVNC